MTLQELLAATYAAVDQHMSDLALETIASDLEGYPLEDVRAALSRARKELRRITLSDIIDRMPGQHPGVEEAWSIVASILNNEAVTVIWTVQMAAASRAASNLRDDPVAARMAFKEIYLRAVAEAREAGGKPEWCLSLGWDAAGRCGPLIEAVRLGRLPPTALELLPPEQRVGSNLIVQEAASALKRIK